MSDDSDTPGLPEVLLAAMAGAVDGLRTSLPGQILAYDEAENRATVQVLVQDPEFGESGERVVKTITLTDVPVAHLGLGSVRIRVKVTRGAPCWLSFSSSCLAVWKQSGKLADPGDDRRHHEADVVAEPWMSIGIKTDAPLIDFDDQAIRIGSTTATQRSLLGDAFLSALGTLVTSIGTAVGTSGSPAGATAAGAAIATALTTFQTAASGYLSQIVKRS